MFEEERVSEIKVHPNFILVSSSYKMLERSLLHGLQN